MTGELTAKSRAGRWALTYYDQAELLADIRDFLANLVETVTGRPVQST